MWFWWFILICDCSIPVTMILAGRYMWKHCPKEINGIMGYRTTMSMKNQDTWSFAHEYAGKLWWKMGWITLVPSVLVHIPFYRGTEDEIGVVCIILMTIQLILMVGSIYPTEKALKRTFNKDGTFK